MDRSTRNLSIITLVVLAIFLALNQISRRADLGAWWSVLLCLLLALAIWFYDRVSHRGVDDSEASETVIEPLTYERHIGSISIPDSVQVAGPGVNVVTRPYPETSPVVEEPTAKSEPVEFQAPPMPPRPRPDVDNPKRSPEAAVETQAAANLTSTPSTDVIERDKSEAAPPAPVVEEHPPATATVTTSIEEKASQPTSAAAPETHPEIAAQSPGGIHAPSVPVSAENAGEPVPTSVSGSAPEPPEPAASADDVPLESVKSKSAASAVDVSSPATGASQVEVPQQSTPVESAANEVEVSASAAAAAPNVGDPNLPMHAVTDQPDDLKIIEGIGPKMEKALQAAGINTFAMLSGASEAQINAAIVAAGMRFAPSAPTWVEQASYAANGDFVGLEAFQRTLKGGRKNK